MKNISVIGAGTMGSGIATVFAMFGYQTAVIELNDAALQRGRTAIGSNLDRLLKKGTITPEAHAQALASLRYCSGVDQTPPDSGLVIEAVFEDKETKLGIYQTLKPILGPDAILATNTSSISITELARGFFPERFIGMHFMNPVPVMKLVEIIRGYSTSEQTTKTITGLVLAVGKTPVEVQDFPGFIANRILMPMINEAIFALQEGVATRDAIDAVMKLGANHPLGPLALADLIGLDVCLAIMQVIYDGFKDSKYRPCPLLVKMVAAGKLGKKSGEGFYQYA
jgi:3-hydroxybutyryl-CoA dehydrogenase